MLGAADSNIRARQAMKHFTDRLPRRVVLHRAAGASLALVAVPRAAWAQADYPNKPIRMLVGFPAGGGVDIAARMVAVELQKILNQSIVVENRPGAGGGLAAEATAKAAPDGYTLLMGNTGSLAINPSIYAKPTYDTLRDFTPVGLVSLLPMVLVSHPSFEAKNLRELIALAKARPGTVNYGTGGQGSIAHLTMELLQAQTGIKLTHVPYKGGTPAIADLLGNQVNLVVEGLNVVAPHVKQGKLRALAVAATRRSAVLPDAPSGAESGHAGFVATAWYGVVAPKGTPQPIVDKLNAAINTLLKYPNVQESLTQQGADAGGGPPAQFGDHLQRETALWAQAVKASGAKVE